MLRTSGEELDPTRVEEEREKAAFAAIWVKFCRFSSRNCQDQRMLEALMERESDTHL